MLPCVGVDIHQLSGSLGLPLIPYRRLNENKEITTEAVRGSRRSTGSVLPCVGVDIHQLSRSLGLPLVPHWILKDRT